MPLLKYSSVALLIFSFAIHLPAQDPSAKDSKKTLAEEGAGADLATIKQEEALQKLKSLEQTMDRLSRLLQATEPQNAVKLSRAFQTSRERLLREGMDNVTRFLKEKKLGRAVESQADISNHLEELLSILLEKDIDPRELIRHIKRLRGILRDVDQVVSDETARKMASDAATESKSPSSSKPGTPSDASNDGENSGKKPDFKELMGKQDATRKRTEDVIQRMKRPVPLIFSPEGGVPGRGDIEKASGSMEAASEGLSEANSGSASKSQEEALKKLGSGRQQIEETLAALQRALRERLLAYLRERFTDMLGKQTRISRETRSLDARLRALAAARESSAATSQATPADEAPPGADRKDLQRADELSRGEGRLVTIAIDVIDLLEEDGTTVVFPRIVAELRGDLENVQGLLARVQTGELTQRIQKEIEESLREILEAIKVAQKSPPPPNPNQGRDSKSGAGPLLPTSAELKMIRSMQQRVNNRTRDFDLDRGPAELDLEEKRQAEAIAGRQSEIEDLLLKIAAALGG